jgi:hypothetical protein
MARLSLAAGLAGALLLVVGCGSADTQNQASDEKNAHGELALEREDGSRIEIADEVRAWCGILWDAHFSPPEEQDKRETSVRWLNVVGGELPRRGSLSSYWTVTWPVSAIEKDPVVNLPVTDNPWPVATMYVADSETKKELTSWYEETAKGTIAFTEMTCEPGKEVRLEIDATLGPENAPGGTATAKGKVSIPVSTDPYGTESP